LTKAVVGLLLIGLGGVLLFVGLISLGWQRHGASSADIGFLHLDWIFHPELAYWSAHMSNLAIVLAGLICIVAGACIFLRMLLATGQAQ